MSPQEPTFVTVPARVFPLKRKKIYSAVTSYIVAEDTNDRAPRVAEERAQPPNTLTRYEITDKNKTGIE